MLRVSDNIIGDVKAALDAAMERRNALVPTVSGCSSGEQEWLDKQIIAPLSRAYTDMRDLTQASRELVGLWGTPEHGARMHLIADAYPDATAITACGITMYDFGAG